MTKSKPQTQWRNPNTSNIHPTQEITCSLEIITIHKYSQKFKNTRKSSYTNRTSTTHTWLPQSPTLPLHRSVLFGHLRSCSVPYVICGIRVLRKWHPACTGTNMWRKICSVFIQPMCDSWYWITDVIHVHPESMSEKCHGNDIPNEKTVLLLEPFYGGSHKQLIDTLINGNIQGLLVLSLWSNRRKYESRIIDTLQGCEYFRHVIVDKRKAITLDETAEGCVLRPCKRTVYAKQCQGAGSWESNSCPGGQEMPCISWDLFMNILNLINPPPSSMPRSCKWFLALTFTH